MVDRARIIVRAGKGGNGIVSFRRERFIPKGGPDGGDGGNGGDVFIEVDPNAGSLLDFTAKRVFEAEKGGSGGSKKMHGANGADLVLKVPLGTVARIKVPNRFDELVYDFDNLSVKKLIAKGGHGGRGNVHFKSSTNRTPRIAEEGTIGEEREIVLELKMMADVGIIGLPNVGKSTLLSVLTDALPKIGDYQFTTLEPNLGVMKHKGVVLMLADIPGLIEGASEGRGLGYRFLKHVERTKVLLHVVCGTTGGEIYNNYKVVKQEMEKYEGDLLSKSEVLVINKVEMLDPKAQKTILAYLKRKMPQTKVLFVSAATLIGIDTLKDTLIDLRN